MRVLPMRYSSSTLGLLALLAMTSCRGEEPAKAPAAGPSAASLPAVAPTSPPTATPVAPPVPPPVTVIPFAGGNFEDGGVTWDFRAAAELARVIPEAAVEGRLGLRLESTVDDQRAVITSQPFPVVGGVSYRLTWQARVLAGGGTNLYLRFRDAAGRDLGRDEGRINDEGKRTEQGPPWNRGQIVAVPPAGAVTMEVQIERPNWRAKVYTIDIDDLVLTRQPLVVAAPWPGTYKIRPDERDRLTAADVVGPDDRVYPDFTWAGVPGGIPKVPVKERLADAGARPGQDITDLLEAAIQRVGAAGGGTIELDAGTFVLERPIFLFQDGVVVRGAGQEATHLQFRYRIPLGELSFFRLTPGQDVAPGGAIEFHANPKDLVALELRVGDQRLDRRERRDHWGNTFALRVMGRVALDRVGAGMRTFTARAEYADGSWVEGTIDLRLVTDGPSEPATNQLAAINIVGRGNAGVQRLLHADVPRGSRVVTLSTDHGLAVGDHVTLVAPASERWRTLVGHTSHWAIQAQGMFQVTAVEGGKVTLHQPVRTTFAIADGSYLQKIETVRSCGIEDLTLEQMEVPDQGPRGPWIPVIGSAAIEDLWTSGIVTHFAWGCWIKGVNVINAGRNALYFPMSKHIEIRDGRLEGSLFTGVGGTGYVGFDRSWDCLMDNVQVLGMRHAPNCQWNASGNVVRQSRFDGSDGQWHAGWTIENLYEGNIIDARGKNGSYGHGLYASGPTSGIHGPQGPRNVVWGNDVIARKDGIHMLGGNEAWLILHNRFVTEQGRAVFVRERSFDHAIVNNVFVLQQAVEPVVFLGVDAVGVELLGNRFYGVRGPVVGFKGGLTSLARDEDNRAVATIPAELPPVPTPTVPSLFLWQRAQAAAVGRR